MDGAGDQLLADAGFAFDQHGNGRRGRALPHGNDARHCLRPCDDVGEGQLAFTAVLDALQFAFQRAGIECVAQRDLETFDADWLYNEIMGTRAHRGHDIVDAAMRGLHNHWEIEPGFADFRQHAHAVEARHDKVEHQRIDRFRVGVQQQGNGCIAVFDRDGVITAALHHIFDESPLYCVVVGNQNGCSHGVPRVLVLSVSNRGTLADAD